MKKKIKINMKERGSALLMTLGILSLALIMAMSFAFSARTTRQIAKVNSDQVKARLFAESGLERVKALLHYGYVTSDSAYLPNHGDRAKQSSDHENVEVAYTFNNEQKTSNDYNQSYLVSVGRNDRTGASFDGEGSTAEDLLGIQSDSAVLPMLEWSRILTDNVGFLDIKSDGKKIDGRMAWIVIEEANKLDVNRMISLEKQDSGTDVYNNPVIADADMDAGLFSSRLTDNFNPGTDYYYNLQNVYPPAADVDESNTVRQGLSLSELKISNDYLEKLPYFERSGVHRYIPWESYRQLNNQEMADEAMSKKYTFFSDYDIEAYWDGSVERQRFDLTGFEWRASTASYYDADFKPDAVNTANVTGWSSRDRSDGLDYKDAAALVEALVGTSARPEFFEDPVNGTVSTAFPKQTDGVDYTYNSNFGIPYLNTLDSAINKQIAANMVDFCDWDFYATVPDNCYPFDSEKENILAGTKVPDYWGNEAVPYFEEFALEVEKSIAIDLSDPALPKANITMKLIPSLDMVQVNEADGGSYPDSAVTVRVHGTLKVQLNGTDVSVTNITMEDGHIDFGWTYAEGTASPAGLVALTSTDTEISATQAVLVADEVKLLYEIKEIVMLSYDEDGKRYFDFAHWEGTVSGEILVKEQNSDAIDTGTAFACSWQVKDMRFNSKSDSWEVLTDKEDAAEGFEESAAAPNCNIAAVRTDYRTLAEAATDYDTEEYDGMNFSAVESTFSTAFIPNRPFRNIWELGAIHRGQPFRTLSLLEYDKAIVDQVKIGPVKKRRDTFNCNTRNIDVWKELVAGIDVTTHYKDISSGESGTEVNTTADIAPVASSLSRSGSAEVFAALNPTTLVNDREKEAFLGRTVGMLGTRNDKYTVLVAAQSLMELPDVPVSSETDFNALKDSLVNPVVYHDADGNKKAYSVLATQRIMAHLVYDVWRRKMKVVQIYHLED